MNFVFIGRCVGGVKAVFLPGKSNGIGG